MNPEHSSIKIVAITEKEYLALKAVAEAAGVTLNGSELERFSKRCVLNLSCAVKNRRGVREFWDEINKDVQAEIIAACERAVVATVWAFQQNVATQLSTNRA